MKTMPLLLALFPLSVMAEPPQKKGGTVSEAAEAGFVRFEEDAQGARLETAVVHYERSDGAHVTLVGAIHVGDEAYYDKLNDDFKTYDEVLFELVGDPSRLKKPEAERPSRSPGMDAVAALQLALKKYLDLTHQLEEIDYSAKNFVHADMDTKTFVARQAARGEGFFQMWIKSMIVQFQKGGFPAVEPLDGVPNGPSVVEMLSLMVKGESAPELKRFMGREMHQLDGMMEAMEGPDGSVIVSERNAVAFDVLKASLAKGVENIAIFYGAAHLPDMAQRLEKMGFAETGCEWRTAWNIPPPQWKAP